MLSIIVGEPLGERGPGAVMVKLPVTELPGKKQPLTSCTPSKTWIGCAPWVMNGYGIVMVSVTCVPGVPVKLTL